MQLMFKQKKKDFSFDGLLPAVGVVGYISLVALLMTHGEELFGRLSPFLGGMLFLSLFVVSGLICSITVLYTPYTLFMKKKYMSALAYLVSTTKWFVFFFLLLLIAAIIL